ncbi:hypothetical protein J6590_009020 [Homalodisca vitripennis]|nr:hypothetical protein J6590_009020 [Homalodisca vitripennis]
MPAIWAELVLAHFQRLQTRNAAQDFGSVSPAQSAFHYYNSLGSAREEYHVGINNAKDLKRHGRFQQTLEAVTEIELIEHIELLEKSGFGLTSTKERKLSHQLAIKN